MPNVFPGRQNCGFVSFSLPDVKSVNLLKKSTSLFVVQILNWVYFFQINLQGLLGCFSRCAYACLSLELRSKLLTRNEPGAFQMIWTITAILKLDVICNAAHLEGISLRDS